MTPSQWESWILTHYSGIVVTDAYRERSFFYNPDGSLPKGVYFATIKESDGPRDKASRLDREGVYRLSTGIGKKHYQTLFGPVPPRPAKGEIIGGHHDFTVLDTLTPHPIYAWIGWIAINSPDQSQEILRHWLDVAYQNAVAKFRKKTEPTRKSDVAK